MRCLSFALIFCASVAFADTAYRAPTAEELIAEAQTGVVKTLVDSMLFTQEIYRMELALELECAEVYVYSTSKYFGFKHSPLAHTRIINEKVPPWMVRQMIQYFPYADFSNCVKGE